jgi:amino acid transporter
MATLVSEPIVHGKPIPSKLKTNTLNLFDATIIATSSVAPAYSVAATLALIVAFVGLASPAAILVSFAPVLCIAFAYYYLNRMDPNCGASYSWISRTLSPYVGWFSGWVQLAANILFCASAPIVAGVYTMRLLNSIFPGQITSDAASDVHIIAVVGILWLALVTFMVVRGIRLTANFQWLLVAIEYLIVLGFAVFAIIKIVSGQVAAANPVSASWFNPTTTTFAALAGGAALGVFFFWGWDTAANVNEETKDAEKTPGQAGIISMFVLLFIFLVAATAIQALISTDMINSNSTDILYFFSTQLASSPITYLMILAVLSSTVAVVQTTLLPSSRLSFSMARDGVFPKAFGLVHSSWRTPWVGTLLSSLAALILILLVLFSSGVSGFFASVILDIGVLVAFYYGVTGVACAWAFRKVLFHHPRMFLFAGLLPFLGALFLFAIAGYVVYNSIQTDISIALPVLGTMGLGIPLLVLAVIFNRTGFFREKTVSYIEVNGKLQTTQATPSPVAVPAAPGPMPSVPPPPPATP